MTGPLADQYAAGDNRGEQWSVARYGTLVVAVVNGRSDDVQCSTEAQAAAEFAALVAAWSNVPAEHG